MMPKGVEHVGHLARKLPQIVAVKIPMMPKGVEHVRVKGLTVTEHTVKIPMMPKGVEHKFLEETGSAARG